jgi:hypothetical protein
VLRAIALEPALKAGAILHGENIVEVRVHRAHFLGRQLSVVREADPPTRFTSDQSATGLRMNRSWCRGLCETLPIVEGCFDSVVLNHPCIIGTDVRIEISSPPWYEALASEMTRK